MYHLLCYFTNFVSKYHQGIVSLSMYHSEDLLLDCLSQSNCSFRFCLSFYTHPGMDFNGTKGSVPGGNVIWFCQGWWIQGVTLFDFCQGWWIQGVTIFDFCQGWWIQGVTIFDFCQGWWIQGVTLFDFCQGWWTCSAIKAGIFGVSTSWSWSS
jgi:hypothetical protein